MGRTTQNLSLKYFPSICILIFASLICLTFAAPSHEVRKTQKDVNIVAVVEKSDVSQLSKRWTDGFKKQTDLSFIVKPVEFEEGLEYECMLGVFKAVSEGVALILDLTWRGRDDVFSVAQDVGVPYLRLDVTIMQFVNSADDFLQNRNASDAALIFPSDEELDQALNYLVGNTVVRLLVLHGLNSTVTGKLRAMRPMPSNYVIYGTTTEIYQIFDEAYKGGLVSRESRWMLAYEDFGTKDYGREHNGTITKINPDANVCCQLLQQKPGSSCSCGDNVKIQHRYAELGFEIIAKIFQSIKTSSGDVSEIVANSTADNLPKPAEPATNDTFMGELTKVLNSVPQIVREGLLLKLMLKTNVKTTTPTKTVETMGYWTTPERFVIDPSQKDKIIKRFFRIGVAETRPFTYIVRHANGTQYKDGFCIRLLQKIAEKMDFEYQLVEPIGNAYGAKDENGTWDGLVGDLVNGATDIVVAALTMTSEREEVIDFVAPHFDQSGISIVMRKPEKEVSLFKFMSVLEPEVWWCILAAIIVTAVVLWLLDKYSPFSGQNKKRYPYECRKFTLVECFWFALTSITPQGGGEPPKAVSGRILVAAYWLFVVLMLATFTANLAAFLTVERMQSPVTSLEELAKQSKINYTVVKGSSIEQYFINMAAAEDDLYRVWKDMTLNSSTDQAKYRVWDYPIKEQYNRILNVIQKTGPVPSEEEGYKKLLADKDGEFAFIHDAAEIRYEVYRSCNLMEIGEPFAEQPYAIAVQSGSHLQEEISKVLLELQKDRYFEQLYNVFWNASKRRDCPNYEEAEGITLQSLGGVFIATLVGLAIGMLTLLGEVLMYKRKQKDNVQPIDARGNKVFRPRPIEAPRTLSTFPRSRFTYRY